MQAIILAAGMGKRLKDLTNNNTKCMVEVNGVSLIDRMLHQIERKHLSRIVIVIGYEGQKLIEYIDTLGIQTPIVYVNNPIYDKTNNIYSLALAKDWLCKEDTLLFESDLIFEDSVIDALIDDPRDTLALVDKYESWMDGTCVKLTADDEIEAFIPGKKFKFNEIHEYYKTVNIYKFSKHFSETHYVPFLDAYQTALGENEYYEQVLRVITMLDDPEIKAKRLSGQLWYEIDDVQDLDIASSMFMPDEDKRVDLLYRRYGGYWRYPQLTDFCYLVNPYFPPQKLTSMYTDIWSSLAPAGVGEEKKEKAKDSEEIRRMKESIEAEIKKDFGVDLGETGAVEKTETKESKESKEGQTAAAEEVKEEPAQPETDPMEDLNALVGMSELKNDVKELVNLVKVNKLREEKGMKTVPVSLHLVFTGNPGTGKTTIARILARLYKQIGVLSKGQLIEVDRSGLVAGYVGQTATKTAEKLEEAYGGILFIDEAYTLASGQANDFGQEAIDTILKAMEDHRDNLIVIVAGYPDLMERFINSNPGLKSRFNKYIHFPDYNKEELIQIFDGFCQKYDYQLFEEDKEAIYDRIRKMEEEKDENFANARSMRNLFESMITNQASRIAEMDDLKEEDMKSLKAEDLE